jgi:hypothetical protein
VSADGQVIDSLYWELALDPSGVTQGANAAENSIDKLSASAVALQGRFQQIQTDINEASAAFKAGTISAEDYATALKFARTEAQNLGPAVNQAGEGAAVLNQILNQTEAAANTSTRGLQQAGRGIALLAASAVGGNSAVAQLAQGLLVFNVGTGVTAGILAGVAAIAGAYDLLTKAEKATKKAADDAADALLASTQGTLEAQATALDQRIQDIQDKAAERLRNARLGLEPLAVAHANTQGLTEEEVTDLAKLTIAKQKASDALKQIHQDTLDDQKKESDKASESIHKAAAEAQQFAQETQAQLAKLTGNVVDATVAQLEAFLAKYSKVVGNLTDDQRRAANAIIADLEAQIAAIKSNSTGVLQDFIHEGATPEQEHGLIDAANHGGGAITGTGSIGPKPDVVAKVNESLSKQIQLIAQAARGAFELANAFGLIGDNASKAVGDVISIADAGARLADAAKAAAKAGTSIATGDLISGALAIAGGIVGLISALTGPTAEDIAAQKSREIQQQNTDALKELTRAFDSFSNPSTGFQQTTAQSGAAALLNAKGGILDPTKPQSGALDFTRIGSILSGVGTNLADLEAIAKSFGITIDTTNAAAFTDSLKALQAALDAADKTHFLDTFTGQMQALNDHFAVFNITDPVEKLKEIMRVLGNPPRQVKITNPDGSTRLVNAGGQGSSAIADALGGLDLGNAGDRAKALTKIEELLTALTNGQIDAAARGGLSSKDFEQELLQLSGLLRDANAQVGGQSQSFAVDRTITEITGDQIRALLDTQLVYQQNLTVLPEIRDLLAGRLSGAISAPTFPASLGTAPGSLTVVIQAGAFPLTIQVPPGANPAAIGTQAAQAQVQALDQLLAQRGKLKVATSGGVLQ